MEKSERATFGISCRWHAGEFFVDLDGVRAVSVGRIGENEGSPVQQDIGEDSEVIDVDFDPSVIGYRDLLGHFWSRHDPTDLRAGRYASVIFTRGQEQYEQALQSRLERQRHMERDIVTQVLPVESFYTYRTIPRKRVPKGGRLRYRSSCT